MATMKGNREPPSNSEEVFSETCNNFSLQKPLGQSFVAAPATNNGNDRNSLLDDLLAKLRPFQREAFDFATQGKIHRRQSPHGTNATARSTTPSVSSVSPDPSLLGKGRILLADEMGLGKTVTSLAIMSFYRDEWPLLILCPASLRHTWPAEIEKFIPSISPKSVYVVSGYDDADFYDNPGKRRDIKIVVATYSLLQRRSAAARVLEQYQFQCVIADESHNLKQKNSQRCQLALPLLQGAKRLVLLSGTPALARPVELWTQVYSLAPALFGPYTSYTQRYCNARRGRFGWDVSGISNANELHLKLQQIMVRRLKSEVLHELPAKQRSIVPITIDRENVKPCREVMDALRQARIDVNNLSRYLGEDSTEGEEQNRSAHWDARRLLMQAYQAGGVGKATAIADYLLDWLAGSCNSQKVLVFAHHKAVLDIVEMAVSKVYKAVAHIRIDGQVPPHERAQRVRKFQTNPQVRVALLSITAAGVGLTLTAASTVMMAELHWTPGVLAQAEDRCHRLGQTNAVQVLYLVCKDPDLSVDMQLWQMIAKKTGDLGQVMDGSKVSFHAREPDPGNNSNRFNFL
jgi:SWI/SNF-related matrix-associated actin-dependent regulator 1 of chromatin subfamily A